MLATTGNQPLAGEGVQNSFKRLHRSLRPAFSRWDLEYQCWLEPVLSGDPVVQ